MRDTGGECLGEEKEESRDYECRHITTHTDGNERPSPYNIQQQSR